MLKVLRVLAWIVISPVVIPAFVAFAIFATGIYGFTLICAFGELIWKFALYGEAGYREWKNDTWSILGPISRRKA